MMVGSHFVLASGEVRTLVRVTQRQLAHWDKTGVVCPSGHCASGSGSRRLYTLRDIIKLKVIVRLREAGVPLQKVRKALDLLENLPDEASPLAELEILTDGRRILVRNSHDDLLDPLLRQYALRLPISSLLAEVSDATRQPRSQPTLESVTTPQEREPAEMS